MIWLWRSRSPVARIARVAVAPLSAVFRITASARARAYASGRRRVATLPAPTVAVGALQVGGAGKTPVAGWIARWYADRGVRPGILLRGYGGDEGDVHRAAVPGAVVEEDADRRAAARRAVARGARVLVLDDAFQRLDVRRDLDLVLVSAELVSASRWALPGGPWREGWAALRRADTAIVTVKTASADAVEDIVARVQTTGCPVVGVVGLAPRSVRGMRTGADVGLGRLRGRRVLASAGVADPRAFAEQIARLGAHPQLMAWRDHRSYDRADVARIVRAGEEVDYVVVTAKDAVKLRPRWPAEAPEPLVLELGVSWINGRRGAEALLAAALEGRNEPGGQKPRQPWMRVA